MEKGYTFQTLAPKVPCTPYTLGQKVSNETSTTLEEANILANELDIDDKEFTSFFCKYSCKKQQK